jgi:hypothetical protein
MGWISSCVNYIGIPYIFIFFVVLFVALYCYFKGSNNIHIPQIGGYQQQYDNPPSYQNKPQYPPQPQYGNQSQYPLLPIASKLPPPPLPISESSKPAKTVTPKVKKGCKKIHEGWCRKILEENYGKPFPSVKDPRVIPNPNPKFVNSKRHALELDCYNEEVGKALGYSALALEYSGRQHYDYPDPAGWNKTEADFKKLIRYDQHKKNVCEEKNIYLICVPYHKANTYEETKQFILSLLPPPLEVKT